METYYFPPSKVPFQLWQINDVKRLWYSKDELLTSSSYCHLLTIKFVNGWLPMLKPFNIHLYRYCRGPNTPIIQCIYIYIYRERAVSWKSWHCKSRFLWENQAQVVLMLLSISKEMPTAAKVNQSFVPKVHKCCNMRNSFTKVWRNQSRKVQ